MIRYEETASAPGAWHALLKPRRPTTREQAQAILTAACTPEVPVSAAIQEIHGEAIRVVLLRDPSVTHGTPSIEDCETHVGRLAAGADWTHWEGNRKAWPIVVVLGLREGYDLAATVHTPDAVRRSLPPGCGVVPVHLLSARRVGSGVRAYDEPGVVIEAHSVVLPAIVDVAHHLKQERLIVTDFAEERTYALRRTEPGGTQ